MCEKVVLICGTLKNYYYENDAGAVSGWETVLSTSVVCFPLQITNTQSGFVNVL